MVESANTKTILVTGATSGIGYQAALDLVKAGATVLAVGRSPSRCQQARESILKICPEARIDFLIADLSVQTSVHQLADQVMKILDGNGNRALDVLYNNAGIYASRRTLTRDGIEMTFAVNHLAPFLLTQRLLPALQRAADGRVITTGSASHYQVSIYPSRPEKAPFFIGIQAYAISKLSNILFSFEFNRRVPTANLQAWVVDPGLVNTDIGLKDSGFLSSLVWRNRQKQGTSAEVPARTVHRLALAPRQEISDSLYWKDCEPKAPSRLSQNGDLARLLWEKSCHLTGIEDYFAAH